MSTGFRYFNSYMGADVNVIDVMIADEAHRTRETSNNRFTPKVKQSKLPQIQELLKASRTSVFFIDDNQIVRPGEIGSAQYIKAEAEKLHCKVREFELEAQFRCAGSEAFVSWINNTLGVQRTPHVMWNQHHEFDFRILSNPQALEDQIRKKNWKKNPLRGWQRVFVGRGPTPSPTAHSWKTWSSTSTLGLGTPNPTQVVSRLEFLKRASGPTTTVA